MTDLASILLLLEATILEYEVPDYIEVSEQQGCIYILVSKEEYKKIPLHERIQKVNALLEFDHEDILDKWPVIVECLDSDELTSLFELYGKKQ